MNPYAQQWGQQGSSAPSVYGALPSLGTSGSQADAVTFTFTNFKTTILNSTIVGPGGRTVYTVTTDSSTPACTIFKDTESKNVGMIQWQPNASVEIRGGGPRTRVRDWLRLASDQSRRIVEFKGVQYAWAPMDGFICMYKVHSSAPRVLARVSRVPNSVTLELTQEAFQGGLLEPALIVTVLLSCGHNID